jgi:hypothetical protein
MSEVPMNDVYQRLAAIGYVDELVAANGHLVNPTSGAVIDPAQVRATETSRFEGSSDPDDAAIVVAVADLDGEPLGVFTAPYGPNASADEASVLTAMKPEAVVASTSEPSGPDDYCAAVFASPTAAEAAIDELREMGVNDDHMGVAMATEEPVAVKEGDEAEVTKDLKWGSGIGAAGGAVGGMLLFSLAVPGFGVLGVGGLAAAGIGGGVGGSVLGAYLGLATDKDDVEEHQRTPTLILEHDEVLVIAPQYDHRSAIEAVLQRHGGRLVDVSEAELPD